MSNQAMTWAYKQDVTPTGAKFVLVTLANYANGDGYCYASQERIAEDTGQDERSVRRHLSDLEESGWIVRERRSHKSGARAPDGFYLVGFSANLPDNLAANLPDNLAANLPDNLAANLPDNLAGSETSLPDNLSEPTGQFVRDYKGIEPTIEPTIRETRSSSHVRAVPKPSRASDPIWDALVAEIGHGPATKSERGAWNQAVSQLRDVDATPEQVRDRCRRYRSEWPKIKLTPTAIVRHWSEFATPQVPEYQPPAWNGWKD